MYRKLPLILLLLVFSACTKNNKKAACGTQICTDLFATIGIHFTDKTSKPIAVQNFTAINQRTHLQMTRTIPMNELLVIGYYIVADDSMMQQLSTAGDDILVSGTDPATNQTKTVTLKISGGCNCHVAKLSGPDEVAFD